jgi:hypothetical protein
VTVEGRRSSVGAANRYRLDGPGIETRWGGEIFGALPGAHPASCTMGTGYVSRELSGQSVALTTM